MHTQTLQGLVYDPVQTVHLRGGIHFSFKSVVHRVYVPYSSDLISRSEPATHPTYQLFGRHDDMYR